MGGELVRTAPPDLAAPYDEAYYRSHCGRQPYERSASWLRFFGDVADTVVRVARPATVVDVGCAFGFLVEALWDRNVRAEGFDVSPYAISNVRADVGPYCRVASITEPAAGRYDVATCFEVLEHVPAEHTTNAVQNLTALADVIMFSSTPSDLAEATHVNLRPTLAWLEAFADAGFAPDPRADISSVAPHAIVFRKAAEPIDRASLFAFSEIVRLRIACANQHARAGEIEDHRAAAVRDRDALREQLDRVADARDQLVQERGRFGADAATLRARLAAEYERTTKERYRMDAEHERLAKERDRLTREYDRIAKERDRFAESYGRTVKERDDALRERDRSFQERDLVVRERDRLVATSEAAAAGALAERDERDRERHALSEELTAERALVAALRNDLADARQRCSSITASAEALFNTAIAETRSQTHETELLTQVVVTSRFWRVKLALLRLFRRRV